MPPDSPSLPLVSAVGLAACRRSLAIVEQRRGAATSRRLVCDVCGETYPDIATYPLCRACSAKVTIGQLHQRRAAELRLPPLEGVA